MAKLLIVDDNEQILQILSRYAQAQGPAVLVWDQGTGIPPEDQERIFRPFFRSSKQAGSIPGEGLGLAIARELCTLLGVEVRMEHTGPEGSTFSLHPPAAG